MNLVSIYQYRSAASYLRDAFEEKKKTDTEFSIRKFCRTHKFGSHAYLLMILKGKRKLNLKQVPSLVEGLELTGTERAYLQTMIQFDGARTEEERDLYTLWMNDLNPKREFRILEAEQYRVISDWIHMTILTLAKIKDADLSPDTIHLLVNKKVSLPQIRGALERLVDLGLLVEKKGKYAPTFNSVTTQDDISNRGAREYHKQVARLAIDAVEEQKPDEREFQSFAVTVPTDKISLAKDMIRKFRHQFAAAMEAKPGDEVYQCNLQFFRLTDHSKQNSKLPKKEDKK